MILSFAFAGLFLVGNNVFGTGSIGDLETQNCNQCKVERKGNIVYSCKTVAGGDNCSASSMGVTISCGNAMEC